MLIAITAFQPSPVGRARVVGVALEGAVVATVSITFALIALELNVTLVGDTLQLLSEGNPVHCGTMLNVPVSPFIAVSVSDVLPDCPGLAIVIEAGLAATEKSGAAVIVTVALPDELV